MNLHDDFYDRIKHWARTHNTKIEAVMAGCSDSRWTQSVYYGWRKSDGLPKGENILALARYMGVSCDWLMTGTDATPAVVKYADLLGDLEAMDATTLESARIVIASLAEHCRKKTETETVG